MDLEYWMNNKKLNTIKKCKDKLNNNLPDNCKILERKELHKGEQLMILMYNKISKVQISNKIYKKNNKELSYKLNNKFKQNNCKHKMNRSNKINIK